MRTQRAKLHWIDGLIVATICAVLLIAINDNNVNCDLNHTHEMEILYEAIPTSGAERVTREQMDSVVEIVRQRFFLLGVDSVIVAKIGDNKLSIQIPVEKHSEKIERILDQIAMLQFIDTEDNPVSEGDVILIHDDGKSPFEPNNAGAENHDIKITGKKAHESKNFASADKPIIHYYTKDRIIFDASNILSAKADIGKFGEPFIRLVLDNEGERSLREHTSRNIGKTAAIAFDGKVISSPVINSVIPHGQIMIVGDFCEDDTVELAILLNSGPLPVPIKKLSDRLTEVTLDEESYEMTDIESKLTVPMIAQATCQNKSKSSILG